MGSNINFKDAWGHPIPDRGDPQISDLAARIVDRTLRPRSEARPAM